MIKFFARQAIICNLCRQHSIHVLTPSCPLNVISTIAMYLPTRWSAPALLLVFVPHPCVINESHLSYGDLVSCPYCASASTHLNFLKCPTKTATPCSHVWKWLECWAVRYLRAMQTPGLILRENYKQKATGEGYLSSQLSVHISWKS